MYENNLKVMLPEEKNLVETFMKMRDEEKVWKLTEFYNELVTNRQRPIDENRQQLADDLEHQV